MCTLRQCGWKGTTYRLERRCALVASILRSVAAVGSPSGGDVGVIRLLAVCHYGY